jgi:hypothetical protein
MPLVLRRLLALVALAAALLVVVRALLGVTLRSDAYSYLVYARELVVHGRTAHSAYDYTVPKPLELAWATAGQVLGAPLAVFGFWTMLGLVCAAAAAALLAARLGGRRTAVTAALLALVLPVLWRGTLAGDSNVPYAALVVAAAALGAATLPASGLLALAGLLRPEAWGVAVVSAALGWRRAGRRERIAAVAAALAPPLVWVALDRILTGDATWSSDVLSRYVARFHPPALSVLSLPVEVASRAGDLAGWPVVALGAVALVVGIARGRLRDPAVAYPLALLAALAVEVARNEISADDLTRMLTTLALFSAVGAAVLVWRLPRPAALAAVAFCALLPAAALLDVAREGRDQAADAAELEATVGPAVAAARCGGPVATALAWQGALALYSGLPRRGIVPLGAARSPCLRVVWLRLDAPPPRVGTVIVRSGGWRVERP